MAEVARKNVQQSGDAPDVSVARRPFVAPAVEHLGRLETTTLLSVVIP